MARNAAKHVRSVSQCAEEPHRIRIGTQTQSDAWQL